jgi:uncharacterized protein
MIRIGVLSDTHLYSVTEEFVAALQGALDGVDLLFHAGDITSKVVYEYLCNWNLKAVAGNMDDFDLASLLPQRRIEEVMGVRIGIIHGRGGPQGIEDVVSAEFPDVDVIVYGHSHIPLQSKRGKRILFNPGAYRGFYGQRGTVGLMEIGDGISFRHISL